jgi:two-component system OmpR family sensor kinase
VRRRLGLALALAPAGIGLTLALVAGLLPESVFVFRVQAGTPIVAAGVGLAVSGLVLLLWWGRRTWRRALARATAAERLAQAAAHRRFIRRLDHEMKNPLTAIRAGLANLSQDGRLETAARPSLATIQWQVERLSRLAGDLRKLADLETAALEQTPVDLADLLNEAVELARATAGRDERLIDVNIQQVPWGISPVPGDRDLLLLALYNLLDNALKFSDPTGKVELRARDDGTWATIEVADTGWGIAPADLPHVTEELHRGQGTQGVEGSGLGLALVRRIAALHAGELVLRSRLGQGTVATFQLPLRRP